MANLARFVIYVDRGGQYRWRLIAPNGKILADSGESYVTNAGCREGIADTKRYVPTAQIEDLTRR